MCGAYFCMGGYKRNGVAEIKMGAYIHQVLFFCVVGAYYPDFTVIIVCTSWGPKCIACSHKF